MPLTNGALYDVHIFSLLDGKEIAKIPNARQPNFRFDGQRMLINAEAFIAQNEALQEERYAGSLASMQEQIVELSALIEETQAEIDALDTPRTAQEEGVGPPGDHPAGYRNTFATLQHNYQQMRLTAAQATHNVIFFAFRLDGVTEAFEKRIC